MLQSEMIISLYFILMIYSNAAKGSTQERKLLNDLLASYNVLERPMEKPDNPVTVYFGVSPVGIISLDAKTGVLQTNLWLTMKWNDFNLKWNPQTYGNISGLRIPPNRIWRPDILSLDSLDPDPAFQTNVAVFQDGSMKHVMPGVFRTICKMDFTYYPFDEQKCVLKFGGWGVGRLELQEGGDTGTGADLSNYYVNSEWQLVGELSRRNDDSITGEDECRYKETKSTIPAVLTHMLISHIHYMLDAVVRSIFLKLSFRNASPAVLQRTYRGNTDAQLSFATGVGSQADARLVMNSWILSTLQAALPPKNTSILIYYFSSLFLINFLGLVVNVITLYLFQTTLSMPDWARTPLVESTQASILQYICPLKKVSKPTGGTSYHWLILELVRTKQIEKKLKIKERMLHRGNTWHSFWTAVSSYSSR